MAARRHPIADQFFFGRYNENHDPDTGQFTSGGGGSGSADSGGHGITGFPAEASVKDEAFNQALERKAYDFTATERTGTFLRPRESFEVTVSAKPTEHAVAYKPRTNRAESLYDPRLADLKTFDAGEPFERKQPVLKNGFAEKIAPLPDKDIIYRGMSAEEYQSFQETGVLKSKGEFNLGETGEHGEGLTFFSPRTEVAEIYANSFAPWQYTATFEKPAYVVAIKRPDPADIKDRSRITSDDEVAIKRDIKKSEVVAAWAGEVFDHTPGNFDLRRVGSSNEYRVGSRTSPSARVAWRKLSDKELAGGSEKPATSYEFVSPSVASHLDFGQAVEAIDGDQQKALHEASVYINGALHIDAREHDIVGA